MSITNNVSVEEGISEPAPMALPLGAQTVAPARNVVSTLITQLLSWVLAFAVTYYLPRYAGKIGFGDLAYAGSFIGVIFVAVPLGTSIVLLREVVQNRERTAELLLATLLLRLPFGLIALGLAAGAAALFRLDKGLQILILSAGSAAIVALLSDAVTTALQGQERITRSNAATIVQRVAESGLIITLVLLKAPLWSVAAASGFAALITLILNLSAFKGLPGQVRHLLSQKDGLKKVGKTAKFLVVAGMPFLGWMVAKQLYGYTDPLVLRWIAGAASVAWYNLAFRLVGTTIFIPVAITSALLPTLTRLYNEDTARFERLARQMFAVIMLTAIPIVAVVACMPSQIIALLKYPAEFAGSIPVLQAGSFSALTVFFGITIGTIIIACGRQQIMLHTSIVGVVVGIPLCIACTFATKQWFGNAAVGAMSSDGLLEIVLIVLYIRGLPFRLFDRETTLWLGRCVAAALLMAGCLIGGGGIGLWAVFPALLIYGVACFLLRCIDKRWVQIAGEMVGRRLVPPAAEVCG